MRPSAPQEAPGPAPTPTHTCAHGRTCTLACQDLQPGSDNKLPLSLEAPRRTLLPACGHPVRDSEGGTCKSPKGAQGDLERSGLRNEPVSWASGQRRRLQSSRRQSGPQATAGDGCQRALHVAASLATGPLPTNTGKGVSRPSRRLPPRGAGQRSSGDQQGGPGQRMPFAALSCRAAGRLETHTHSHTTAPAEAKSACPGPSPSTALLKQSRRRVSDTQLVGRSSALTPLSPPPAEDCSHRLRVPLGSSLGGRKTKTGQAHTHQRCRPSSRAGSGRAPLGTDKNTDSVSSVFLRSCWKGPHGQGQRLARDPQAGLSSRKHLLFQCVLSHSFICQDMHARVRSQPGQRVAPRYAQTFPRLGLQTTS